MGWDGNMFVGFSVWRFLALIYSLFNQMHPYYLRDDWDCHNGNAKGKKELIVCF